MKTKREALIESTLSFYKKDVDIEI